MNHIHAARDNIGIYVDAAFQKVGSAVLEIKRLKNNPDVFQKTCQIGFAVIQGANLFNGGVNLSKLSTICINTAGMHNFLGFLKIPYNYFYPIKAGTINEFALSSSLKSVLWKQLEFNGIIKVIKATKALQDAGTPDAKDAASEALVKAKAQVKSEAAEKANFYVKKLFEEMSDADRGYKNSTDLKGRLKEIIIADLKKNNSELADRLRKELADNDKLDIAQRKTEDEIKTQINYRQSPLTIDLKDLHVFSRTVPLLERISNMSFHILDLVCVPLYLQEWNLDPLTLVNGAIDKVGLSELSKSIGQVKVFFGVEKLTLGDFAWSLCCVGFGFQLLEAIRKLSDERLTAIQKTRAKWTAVNAAAELLYSTASLMQIKHSYILALTIIAKSIGILQIALQPSSKFFDKEVNGNRAAAAAA